MFSINFEIGIIILKKGFNREQIVEYILKVCVQDRGIFVKLGDCIVVIQVFNINDVLFEFLELRYEVNVSEDVCRDMFIIIICVISCEVI